LTAVGERNFMANEISNRVETGGIPNACDHGATFDIREEIWFLLAGAYRYVASVCGEELATYGITPAQFIILTHMEAAKADSQICLSRMTGIDRTTIVGIVDRLEQKGLIARTKIAEDRRVRRIVLTNNGLKLKTDLCVVAERIRSRLTTKISPKGYAELVRLLTRLRE